MSDIELAAAASARRPFAAPRGRSLAFTRLGFGGAPLGNMHRVVGEDEADATLAAAWDAGLRYFDTAPLYGHGLSETRMGRVLAGRPRDEFLISTKVGRVLEPCVPGEQASGIFRETPPLKVRFDYTADGVRRSLDASLERLGLDRVDIALVHDLEFGAHGSAEAYEAHWSELTRGGGWQALDDLRADGTVGAIGLGSNETAACERLLAELDPDLFLLAGRYTLLEQAPLHGFMPACARRGVGIIIGGPFNSGVLARRDGSYDYAAAPPAIVAKVERLAAACARFNVPLPAAALQFAAAHPAVVSVIPGAQTAGEVAANARLLATPIPATLWSALKDEGLVDAAAPVPAEAETAPC
jgi:D-threo-aldose 1-dehydrogenase